VPATVTIPELVAYTFTASATEANNLALKGFAMWSVFDRVAKPRVEPGRQGVAARGHLADLVEPLDPGAGAGNFSSAPDRGVGDRRRSSAGRRSAPPCQD